MAEITSFRVYGEGDATIRAAIQPELDLRGWDDLGRDEKETALQDLHNNGWISSSSREVLQTIAQMNNDFLRICPGKRLHKIPDRYDRYGTTDSERKKAAGLDFVDIFMRQPEPVVFRMFSELAKNYIDQNYLKEASESAVIEEREKLVNKAFGQFDKLANALNHIFRQFDINAVLTREGLVPRQDQALTDTLYTPTLKVLSDPKWASVSQDIAEMFEDYQQGDYDEVITKGHRAVQRFLQILVGDEGKNGKGELAQLFRTAKEKGYISSHRFSEGVVMSGMQSYLASERATKSTAKPSVVEAGPEDALLMMNTVMVFIQHCLTRKG